LSRLADIPVRVEAAVPGCGSADPGGQGGSGGLGGGVTAILSELGELLTRLATQGEPAAIDLRSLPMTQLERERLRHALGDGEVQATVTAAGVSRINETGMAGVWWVEHRDAHGELQAELLEVCRVPEFLARAQDEIAAAGQALSRGARGGS